MTAAQAALERDARPSPASTSAWPAASRSRVVAARSSRRRARRASRALAAPFVLLWLASPAIARWASLSPRVGRPPRRSRPATPARCGSIARRTWRFFETFVTAEDHMAAARQLPGGPEAGRRAPHLADQHRPLPARRSSPRATSAGSGRSRRSSGSRRRSTTMRRLERYPRPLLQLVRHAATCGRSSRSTSPRSTAAISPGT